MHKKGKLPMIALLIIYLTLLFLLRSPPKAPPVLVSHRGAAGLAPENTLVSIEEAMKQGASLIEVDVQRSSDDVLLLMHDKTVNRTTNGRGAVRDLRWEEISQLDAGQYFGAEFAGTRVPSLSELFDLLKNKPVTLVLEIKSPHLYPKIEQQISQAIAEHKLEQQVMIVSFDSESLQRVHELAPTLPLGLISVYPRHLSQLQGAQGLHIFWATVLLDPTLIYRMHQQDYEVRVWTVNNPYLMRLLLWLGVDSITTDRPDLWQFP